MEQELVKSNAKNNLPSLSLNDKVLEEGMKVFRLIGSSKPSLFGKSFWSQKTLEWSLGKPELKRNLFQLIDVLPSLEDNSDIANHAALYLGKEISELNSILGWGLSKKSGPLRKTIVALTMKKAVREMASQFIAGDTPTRALKKLRKLRKKGFAFTVDLLGEYSHTQEEAESYYNRYLECVSTLCKYSYDWGKASKPLMESHLGEQFPCSVSIKLSAMYPKCSPLKIEASVRALSEKLSKIADITKNKCSIYLDAEDCSFHEITLETFFKVFSSEKHKDYPIPGIVLQGYTKNSETIVDKVIEFAKNRGNPVAIRLVKGAYWDSESAYAMQKSLPSPVFSVKEDTDAQYELLSKKLLDNIDVIFPAFGSHNIRSLSYVRCYAEQKKIKPSSYEVQVLYGMAEPIANAYKELGNLVRFYVPIGPLVPGMGYLVRRLLENTSNESFLRHTFFDEEQVSQLLKKPVFSSTDFTNSKV